MGKIKIATTAVNCCYDKTKNLEKCLAFVRRAAAEKCALVLFPEMALQGYLPNLTGPITSADILYQLNQAELVPQGESVQAMINAAKEYNIHIAWGMCERDQNVRDIIYNSLVLVGPEGYIGTYRKVHLTMDEKHVFTAGSEFPVYNTSIGKIGLEICYDKCFPEPSRELALGGAEIILLAAAWADFIGEIPADTRGSLGSRYDLLDSVRALENQIWLVSSNQVGTCGGGCCCGQSNVIAPNGYIIATVGQKEGIATAEIDVWDGIFQCRADSLETELKHLRPDAYKLICSGMTYETLACPIDEKKT